MKQIFASLILLVTFAAVAPAQTDFNYSFYPKGNYTMLQTVNKQDTVKKEWIAKTDTTTKAVPVFVEKVNGRFSVRTLANISQTLYDMNVEFVGVDDKGNMVYKAKTEGGETIFVSPLTGVVEIVFQQCFDEPQPGGTGLLKKHCNTIRHIFGNIAAPLKPSTTPATKPK